MSGSTQVPTDPLLLPVQYLRGIGPRKSAALENIGVRTVFDLFFYVPRRYLDRSAIVTIAQLRRLSHQGGIFDAGPPDAPSAEVRRDFTVVGEVRSFRVMGVGRKARFVLILADQTGSMQCVWFGGVNFWKKAFRIGETLAVSGQSTEFAGALQFVHPDLDRISPPALGEGKSDPLGDPDQQEGTPAIDWAKTLNTGGLVPLYPSGQELARVGLDSAGFRRTIGSLIRTHLGRINDVLPESLLSTHGMVSLSDAIRSVHFPRNDAELHQGLRRLKYHELFLFQLKLALKRRWMRQQPNGIPFDPKSALARRLVDSLPFTLTKAQVRVIREISGDMESPKSMNRLLQGDVGSGKTIVALIAMLIAVENGYQAVFVAPTEILAEQHFKTLTALLPDLAVNIRLLVGAQRTRLRRDVLDDVRSGSAQIIVGTHALFEKNVEFGKLGLVVIDEQHRFGVLQRASIREKGKNPDVLVMTATPIPRTLSLTLYGDLDVSILDELPLHRKPIRTSLTDETAKESVYQFVREQVAKGRQAYFVYPLIEESEVLDLKAATSHFEYLQQEAFPGLRLGLIHGRLPSEEKDRIMGAFVRRELDILVATTVIEVGIDVPNASIMIIENAERFGLSQLHQLRGRVGRGSDQSYCILLTKKWIATRAGRASTRAADVLSLDQDRLAERRLATMASTTDGFKIAEIDLQLRGPGDFFGTRQSGVPQFRVADILTDTALLDIARHDAFALVDRDPALHQPEHRPLAEHLRSHFREELSLVQVG
jgi:ATP-dependent DNA helicase RecG